MTVSKSKPSSLGGDARIFFEKTFEIGGKFYFLTN